MILPLHACKLMIDPGTSRRNALTFGGDFNLVQTIGMLCPRYWPDISRAHAVNDSSVPWVDSEVRQVREEEEDLNRNQLDCCVIERSRPFGS